MFVEWKHIRLAGTIAAGLLGASIELNGCLVEKINAAVSERAASHEDVMRLEGKLDHVSERIDTLLEREVARARK